MFFRNLRHRRGVLLRCDADEQRHERGGCDHAVEFSGFQIKVLIAFCLFVPQSGFDFLRKIPLFLLPFGRRIEFVHGAVEHHHETVQVDGEEIGTAVVPARRVVPAALPRDPFCIRFRLRLHGIVMEETVSASAAFIHPELFVAAIGFHALFAELRIGETFFEHGGGPGEYRGFAVLVHDLAVLKPDVGEKTVLLLNSEENSALFAGKFRIPAGERHDMKRAVPVPDSGKDGA